MLLAHKLFLIGCFFILSESELFAAGTANYETDEMSFYAWISLRQNVRSTANSNSYNSVTLNRAISIQEVANATPLLKYYADLLLMAEVPIDFIVLPLIESANNPFARSDKNANGLWQFIPSTAVESGLMVNDVIDDRFDVQKSSLAAIYHLKKLHEKLKTWELVIVAYNCGIGCVEAAKRKGMLDINHRLDISKLPLETQKYYRKFFEYNKFISHNHSIELLRKFPNEPYLKPLSVLQYRDFLAENPKFKKLNPKFINFINGSNLKLKSNFSNKILFPTKIFFKYFLLNEIKISPPKNFASVRSSCKSNKNEFYITVDGDTFFDVAKKKSVTVNSLLDLNPTVKFIRGGMRLKIC